MIDRTTRTAPPTVRFDPPAPGQWELETGHHGLRPLSPFLRDTYQRAFEAGIVEPMQRYGLPLVTVQAKFVHGCLYMRPLAVGEKPGSTPKAPPPAFVMKLIARVHPELRRRAKTAEQAFTQRRWRQEVDQWFDRDRSVQLAENLALQAVEPGALDDVELAAHVASALSHFERSARRNLATHGGDLVPTGDLLAHCERWGISANEAAGLLTGSSPATVETAVMLGPVASAIRHSGVPVASLETVDDVRALGPDARAAVDAWLEQHMWRTVTSDDVDRATLAEVPALQLAALLGATENLDVAEPDVAAVRARVPGEHRALFDELLAEARYGHRQRDDIRGLCWNWPCGLVRRALLEAGRRLHAAGGRARGCARRRAVPRRARPLAARSRTARRRRTVGRRARRACCRARPHRGHTPATTARRARAGSPTRCVPEGAGSRHRGDHGQPPRRRHATATRRRRFPP